MTDHPYFCNQLICEHFYKGMIQIIPIEIIPSKYHDTLLKLSPRVSTRVHESRFVTSQ